MSGNKAQEVIKSCLAERGAAFPNASALLILDALKRAGVAVTQLPEPAVNLSAEYEDDVTHAWEWDEDSFLALDSDGVAGGTHLLDSRPVEELVPLARAILAAAVVLSEGETQ